MFTIPNKLSTIEYPASSGIYPQAQVDAIDWLILANNDGVGGISSGCAVSQRGAGANQSVDVASGTVVVNDVELVVSSGNLAATAAHATLPRFDLVTVNSSGTKVYTAGTAASTPVFPSIPANSVVLAAIFRRPSDNVIETAELVDKRLIVSSPAGASGWTTVEKSADTTRSNTTTLTADPDLLFPMVANGEYRFRGVFGVRQLTASDFDWRHVGPTSPGLVNIRHQYTGEFDGGTDAIGAVLHDDQYSATDLTNLFGDNVNALISIDGIIHNGANAGNFEIHWAQGSAVAENTIVRAGSYLEYARVD